MSIGLTEGDYAEILRLDLSTFVERVFRELRPETSFAPSPYLDVVASRLEAAGRGKVRRLIVNLPPRGLKSIMGLVGLPAWLLGHHPGLNLICASYGQDLADALARDCRAIMTSEWYRAIFRTRLVRHAVSDIVTTRNGSRFATSVGGPLTGRGADVVIIDDPLKPDEALSDVRRQAVNEWFDNTLMSRLNSQETGVVIVLMQRLHMADLVGHVLDKGGDCEVLSFPAIARDDERFCYETLFGSRVFTCRAGVALHPGRLSLDQFGEVQRRGARRAGGSPRGHRRETLSEGEQAMLVHRVLVGPDPERGGPSSWTLRDLCRFIEDRFVDRSTPSATQLRRSLTPCVS